MTSSERVPRSILIIGSGVFGLSTAYSLCNNALFKNVEVTLVDRAEFPAPDGASVLLPFYFQSSVSDFEIMKILTWID